MFIYIYIYIYMFQLYFVLISHSFFLIIDCIVTSLRLIHDFVIKSAHFGSTDWPTFELLSRYSAWYPANNTKHLKISLNFCPKEEFFSLKDITKRQIVGVCLKKEVKQRSGREY